ncbi:right-handed parallel beta-helix repeat-containing protein [candidate division KSB1 bacterium]|nr:right-handed parallel beta-helix repeat-containing protein [candidate division KSB1 bacterium]
MNLKYKLCNILFFIFLLSIFVELFAATADPYTVSTFECISVYYPSIKSGDCKVFFREQDNKDWRPALDLIYDEKDGEYRGSIVGLVPNTSYAIKLVNNEKEIILRSRTMSEDFPVGRTTYVNSGTEPLLVNESGTVDAYHLVTAAEKSHVTIDVRNAAEYTAIIDADYVIIRGLEFKNAGIHGILIKSGRHHIVIEDCRVTFWGRVGGPRSFGNMGGYDSGIYAEKGAGNLILQRNLIENPRGGSNDWDTGHPNGPQAITLINTTGQNVIRYNDLLSTPDHSYNDIFGGGSNFSDMGSPNRDSDIYGNILRSSHDDAIESEGANMNVRIWGNYIHDTFQFIATASTSKGPFYIFRNIFGEGRNSRKYLGGSMIKTGHRGEFGGGRKYIFHNTALQPDGPLNVFSGHADPNCVTRNNIFHCAGRLAPSGEVDVPGDYDYDLFTGMEYGNAKEPHGIKEIPRFIESYYLEFYPASTINKIQWGKIPVKIGDIEQILTDPVITIPNPVIDGGVVLPNFNDNYTGQAPDLGAFEVDRPPLKFGRHANSDKWAPWERY